MAASFFCANPPRRQRPSAFRGFLSASMVTAGLVLGACGVAGCARNDGTVSSNQAADASGRYKVVGTIVSANAERGSLLVDHEEIPGFMPAMTMEFKVSAGDLANARPGERIRGMMYQSDDGFHLEQIWPEDVAAERIVSEAARALRQDTVTRAKEVYREVGERLPDFALYDQTGTVVQATRFRGKRVVLNFIFTRCPDPNMCPAATARMMQLQRLAQEAGVKNFELVSVTLDPEFDTPGVLRAYAEALGIDTSNFSFLTGPESAIKDLLRQMGVKAFADGPLITHTLATVLIDETGKIMHRVDGSQWDPADFLARLPRANGASPVR